MSNQRAFEELAGIYMSGADERPPVGPGASVTVLPGPLQVVIGGNLPSMAGIWFAQLVDRWSRMAGPCGLVRFDDHKVRLDIFRHGGRLAGGAGEELLEQACRIARSWAIVLPSGFSAAELSVGNRPPILLTGCDEAAIAAARLRIEELRMLASGGGLPLHELQLVTVGSDASGGRRAADELTDWAISSAGVALRWCGSVERVDRLEDVQSVEIAGYGRQDVARFSSRLGALLGAGTRTDDVPRGRPEVLRAGSAMPQQLGGPPPQTRVEEPATMLVFFPELVGVRVRASTAPAVELGVDASGRLHLLSSDPTTRDLRLARSWCASNWALLTSAVVDLRQVRQPVIVDHLVVQDARQAVSLHGAGLLLHALVDGAGQRRRIDLNDEQSAGLAG
jgi:hypothetical protein